ncbi:MAG: hypothetical protein A2848_02630 [Candidatus Magasanikbacteria bacterium RIFCSPHIGHO2_01_FULL_50_8]|uniref:PrgI family protein n=2 Tax=Candidatus Magasanikiibacteriota TaxID=1752731 RepID=A0A1F6LVL1_9BACT|nr:MAG: hypothetical protein A2848_02630 [Candidatus Magasanikbacteria bacterium RIFCSPHIGHO2_01_FULL_50_8]OGH67966.1 MAG: hypothetical protein A3C15_03190 [Candidatus Magasanikbacteria bacterium RIFCSPHIGHO2_02_FULL_50_9b]
MPQQFVVPQFIDAEPKLLGPVTPRQFIILFATVLVCALMKVILPFWAFILVSVILAGLGLTLAFVKINGQSFHYFLLNMLQTMRKPKIRVWQKDLSDAYLRQFIQREEIIVATKFERKQFVGVSRLNELSLIVNTGGVYRPERDDVL